ncbi:MAG: glycosyltransferase [Paracoccaceae bacterium]
MSVLVDVTRTLSRAGRAPTGVDRVERAYIRHAVDWDGHGLARTRWGTLRVGPDGMRALLEAGSRDEALSALRATAVARAPRGLDALALRGLAGAEYLNVGHSNLTPATMRATGRAGLPRGVMIHDAIPLDAPQWQRPGTEAAFRAKLAAAATADRLIVPTAAEAVRVAHHMVATPPITVAPLGLDLPSLGPAPRPGRPYFVTLGTVEPRKDHALLLDVWEQGMEAELLILGARGWENHATLARLDAGVPGVTWHRGLDDRAVAALVAGAQALLMPSRAEGTGLPPLEAAALGTPPVTADLPVYRETLGAAATVLPVGDADAWRAALTAWDRAAAARRLAGWRAPTWDAHFAALDRQPAEAA